MEKDSTLEFYEKPENAKAHTARWWKAGLHEGNLRAFAKALEGRRQVLDLGCGGGRDCAWFRKHGLEPVGADYSDAMLAEAKRRVTGVKSIKADLRERLPFEAATFDGVWARASLHHLTTQELRACLKEIARVLTEGGILFIATKISGESGLDEKGRLYTSYAEPELAELLKTAGFAVIRRLRMEDPRPGISWVALLARKA